MLVLSSPNRWPLRRSTDALEDSFVVFGVADVVPVLAFQTVGPRQLVRKLELRHRPIGDVLLEARCCRGCERDEVVVAHRVDGAAEVLLAHAAVGEPEVRRHGRGIDRAVVETGGDARRERRVVGFLVAGFEAVGGGAVRGPGAIGGGAVTRRVA